jgi:hypothetical protein
LKRGVKPSHLFNSHRLGKRAPSKARTDRFENKGICPVSNFLQGDGTDEPILGLRQDLFSIGDRRKMKVFQGAGGARNRPEKALSQSDQFGAMQR